MSVKLIRILCVAIFIAGIPALIVSSIAGNNEGWVLTFGMTTAIAALIHMVLTATTSSRRLEIFNEITAERIENRVQTLVKSGADETEVRALLRDAADLTRGQQ